MPLKFALFLFFFVFGIQVSAQTKTLRTVIQANHQNSVTHISVNQKGSLILTSDGITSKLWNTKTYDLLQTFRSDYATFNKDGNILTITKIGDDESQVKIYNPLNLDFISGTTISGRVSKVYWNSDSTALLINSGRSNFNNRGNVIINPQNLTIIKSFRAYNVLSDGDNILVVHYIRTFRGGSKYKCSRMDFEGNIYWTKRLPDRYISCCSKTDFDIVDDAFIFNEFTYLIDWRIDYHKAFDAASGKNRSKKSIQSEVNPDFMEGFHNPVEIDGRFFGLSYAGYDDQNYSSFYTFQEFFKDRNIKPQTIAWRVSFFEVSPEKDKIYIGYLNGTYGIYDVKEKTIRSRQVENQTLTKIQQAAIVDKTLYIFTRENTLFTLDLENLSFRKPKADFNYFDLNLAINHNLKKGIFYSEEYQEGVPVINSYSKFNVMENGEIKWFSGRPLCMSPDQINVLVDNGREISIFSLEDYSQRTVAKFEENAIRNAKFSPDGKKIAVVVNDLIAVFDTETLTNKRHTIDIDLNATSTFKGNFSKTTYTSYSEANIAWLPNSDAFYLRMGGFLNTQFAGNFTEDLKFIGKGSLTDDGKYLIQKDRKEVRVINVETHVVESTYPYKDDFYRVEANVVPGMLLGVGDKKHELLKLPGLEVIPLEIEDYSYFDFADYKYAEVEGKKYLQRQNNRTVIFYDIETGKPEKTIELNSGTYNSIHLKNGKYTVAYDFIYEGQFVKVNNTTMEKSYFPPGELPLYSSDALIGEAFGYFDRLTKSYMDIPKHHLAADQPYLHSNNPDDKFIMTVNSNGELSIYNMDSDEKLIQILINNNQFILMTPDNYYTKSTGLKNLKFVLNQKLYDFEQFDLKYNRPDIILDRIGLAEKTTIQAYRKAYLKRLQKLGFTEEMLKDDYHLPEIKVHNIDSIPESTDEGKLELKLYLNDEKYELDRINVWINDVAIYGTEGISLRDKKVNTYETDLILQLAKGKNKIQVSALNKAGTESFKEGFEINCNAGKETPNLYLITIGESKFKQSQFNLTYASKDAEDIVSLMKESKVYKNVFTKTLVNKEVTRDKVLSLKGFLEPAGINDQVIIFIAGHGVLDEKLDYYLATYDMDFNHPANKGLAYEDIEGLLDGIKPLKKILLIDACHSGEIDKEEVELAAIESESEENIQFRVVGNTASPKIGTQNISALSKSIFGDLRKGTGATVISSAGGMEFAMEGEDWKNGLFTYCFLKGIQSGEADTNNDGEIWLSEVQEYVSYQVYLLSDGKQQPTSRIENQTIDFRIW